MREYRIGNIIQFSEINEAGRISKLPYDSTLRLGKVSEIYPEQLEALDEKGKRYMLKEAQPVELTYDILLECGFTKAGDYYHKEIPGTTGLLIYATVTRNNPIGLYLGKTPFDDKDALQLLFHRLTALHHLMNVYYSMALDELVWQKFTQTIEELEELRQPRLTKKNLNLE